METSLLFGLLVVFLALSLMLGQWIAFALGSSGLLVLYLSKGELGLAAISSVIWNTTNSYVLVAIPLFLLMGEVILRSGAGKHFYSGVVALMGKSRGTLLHANTFSCAIFSAVSGSSVATAATVGTVAIPEMLQRGYQPRIVFGSLAAGGTLGILIPPSIAMILYGSFVQQSVSKLFIAGIIPGLVLAGLFLLYGYARIYFNPSLAPQVEAEQTSVGRRKDIVHVIPILLLLGIVLGTIYSGVATPTEAAAIGAAGALIVAAAYRALTWEVFASSVMSTVRTTCMISMIIVAAQILSTALTFSGTTREISTWILELGLSKWTFFGLIVVFYIILGLFVDGISMMYMTLPVLFPPIVAMGFDPIWFGIVLTILIELGQVTPPVGLNLFTIHAIAGGHKFSEVAIGSAPYAAIILFMVVLLAIWPELATWLPSTL